MIASAAPGMERELKQLWMVSFQEESRPVSLFFRMVYGRKIALSICSAAK